MSVGQVKVRLGDVSHINYGYTAKASFEINGPKFLRITDIQNGRVCWDTVPSCPVSEDDYIKHQLKEDDIVFARTGATTGKSYQIKSPPNSVAASYLIRLRLYDQSILPSFVSYFFQTLDYWNVVNAGTTGSAQGGFNASKLSGLLLPKLPLPEQKRIVAILDEAFEGIDKAIANTEKNITNARELFESYLNNIFTQKSEEWIETQLENICSIKHGFAFKSKFFAKEGDYVLLTPGSFYESGGYREQRKKTKYYVGEIPEGYILKKGDFLFAMTEQAVGLLGSSLIVPESNCFLHNQRLGLVQVANDIEWNNDFFFHQFNTKRFRAAVQESASGLKVRHTSPKKLGAVSICFPPTKAEQEAVADKLNRLWVETQRIKVVFRQKLMDLAELKQSLLQKAFSGELTSDNKVIAFPVSKTAKEADPLTPEFTAKILAFAYHRHALKNRQNTFGHVKAQKTLHLVESIGGVELGRKPIKDAAGPNDFQHMLNAEAWAKENQFFEFVSRSEGKGYDFKKLLRYDELMAGVFATIKPYQKRVERVIDLIIPKKSRETELIATVYAAWNNLILDGCEITDKAIIREARENWHADKMKIPVTEFQQAIRFIRDKGIIPDGKAKRVGGQENLF
ncbi:MAG: restriction endonuclease subunit S [Candidatus Polarisedimenticolaceae bacterium]|nr:restriction endonuclease subunit S [Candidatus Polarisedimenticolaceae bacterium]